MKVYYIQLLETRIECIDCRLYTPDEDKCNALNRYFANVFTQEDPNIAPIFHIDKSDNVSLSSINITPFIVFDKLVSLKTGKSPGPGGWAAEVLKQCAESTTVCIPLSVLFIKSLVSGILPEDWKISYITSIYKKDNKTKLMLLHSPCDITSSCIPQLHSTDRTINHHLPPS